MQIYVLKNNRQEGPYDEKQMSELLQKGLVTLSDFGWREGMKEWLPLATIYSNMQAPNVPPVVPSPFPQPGSSGADPSKADHANLNLDPSTGAKKEETSTTAMVVGIFIWLASCGFWTGAMMDVRESGNFNDAMPCFIFAAIGCAILKSKMFKFSWQGIHASWAVAFVIMRFAK